MEINSSKHHFDAAALIDLERFTERFAETLVKVKGKMLITNALSASFGRIRDSRDLRENLMEH